MIKIENLKFSYRKGTSLFDGLSMELPAGNIYGLLGKNGAGKSTLLKNISGLLYPQEGTCTFLDYHSKERLPSFLQQVYFVPEEFYLPPVSLINFAGIYGPFYPSFNIDLLNEYVKEFDLHWEDKLSALSYGQKKKFLLGFGLATKTKLLILDEPTNGLDIPSKSQFRKIIASSIDEDQTYIISTHQVRDLQSLIDPIIILDNGKIIFFRSNMEVSEKLSFIKLGSDDPEENIIYKEETLAGKHVIRQRVNGKETNVDLELLFNAVISNKDTVNNIFNNH